MKRDFLKGLELSDDVINQIMAENGKDIEATKAKFADYEDLKEQLKTANETMEKFKDYDQNKAALKDYEDKIKQMQIDSEKKIKMLERQSTVKEFTSSKKFVNDFTRDSINQMLEKALEDESSKGKSLSDIFTELTKDKANILVDESKPVPPTVPEINKGASSGKDMSDVNKARAIMGLKPID